MYLIPLYQAFISAQIMFLSKHYYNTFFYIILLYYRALEHDTGLIPSKKIIMHFCNLRTYFYERVQH